MILETRDLTKEFGHLVAVDSLDFSVEAGEIRAVIGPNGAGKTTLFDLISGRLTPDSGTVTFRERDITGWSPHRIAPFIGRKFQITNVYEDLTVWENLLVADQAEASGLFESFRRHDPSDRVDDVLATIGLADKTDRVPPELAYGERQWLEIGMVLLSRPEVLLLDEPTAGMSGEETTQTINLLEELSGDRTLVIVEHDIDFIYEVADTISVLHQGRLLAEGSADDIRADERVREVYIGEGL